VDGEEALWKSVVIQVTAEDVPGMPEPYSCAFRFRDMNKWLVGEFKDNSYRGHFHTEGSVKLDADGNRLFNVPHQCDAWLTQQSYVRSTNPDGVVAAVQLFSDKTLVNRKNLSCHPIKATLLNIDLSIRITHIKNVAYLPTLARPQSYTPERWRLVKCAFISKALSIMLDPLKQLSRTGVELETPSGDKVTAFPCLLSYVMDDPEAKDVYGIKAAPAMHPCELCWMEFDHLCDGRGLAEQRTVEDLVRCKRAAVELRSGRALKSQDTITFEGQEIPTTRVATCLPTPFPLCGFANQDAHHHASIIYCVGYESMHNEDLGVFLDIIRGIDFHLTATVGKMQANRVQRMMNANMAALPRAGGFSSVFECTHQIMF